MIKLTKRILRRSKKLTNLRFSPSKRFFSEKEDDSEDNLEEERTRAYLKEKIDSKADYLNAVMKYEKKKTREEKIQEHRDNFLFEKFLTEEKEVRIYDVTNIAYPAKAFKDSLIFGTAQILGISGFLFFGYFFLPVHLGVSAFILRSHYRFVRDFVEKIDFDPVNRKFFFLQRKMITGGFKTIEIDTRDVLFTSDPFLNSLGINYINMDTLDTYSIIYKNGWINKDLFSYLLRQNIKTEFVEGSRDTY